jgi:hypothetical protein
MQNYGRLKIERKFSTRTPYYRDRNFLSLGVKSEKNRPENLIDANKIRIRGESTTPYGPPRDLL